MVENTGGGEGHARGSYIVFQGGKLMPPLWQAAGKLVEKSWQDDGNLVKALREHVESLSHTHSKLCQTHDNLWQWHGNMPPAHSLQSALVLPMGPFLLAVTVMV